MQKKLTKTFSVLERLSNFMSFEQIRVLMKYFIESQLDNCPLIALTVTSLSL